jgi:hypothetical protein
MKYSVEQHLFDNCCLSVPLTLLGRADEVIE